MSKDTDRLKLLKRVDYYMSLYAGCQKRFEELRKVPVVSVEEIEKKVKERLCKSCKYWTDWLKELKKEAKVEK